ncbi:MAG TPA: diadenylate cyclase CdaA [Chloroflexota bacterium]|nr:diadenylate cyclase CdaA [Chloroflexota bacterium]
MSQITWVISHFSALSAVDLILVGLLFYGFLRLIEGTRAVQLLRGMIILVVAAAAISTFSPFPVLNFIIRTAMPALVVAIPVIFQPELRRALERVGRTPRLVKRQIDRPMPGTSRALEEIISAIERLSNRRYGGLIVVEGATGLQEFVDTGVPIDATVTADLLVSIFFPGSPLHDGAVIIHGDRVIAARCVLPLTESPSAYGSGTRHRAAQAITEQSDAVCFVASEETGAVSIAANGTMYRGLDRPAMESLLGGIYGPINIRPLRFRRRGRATPRREPEKPAAAQEGS